jgi:uncharacterized membrane protein (UPF0127 family)
MRYGFSAFASLSLVLGLAFGTVSCSATVDDATDDVTGVGLRSEASPIVQSIPTPTVQEDLAQVLPISAETRIGDQVIHLEVARTEAEQTQGLMYRPALPDDRGMLFPFDQPRPLRFWMRNTPQPLDMVFLLDGEVKAVIADVPPCTSQPCPTYGPMIDVNQVIELRSGRAAELGLKAGDQLEIRFFEPK